MLVTSIGIKKDEGIVTIKFHTSEGLIVWELKDSPEADLFIEEIRRTHIDKISRRS